MSSRRPSITVLLGLASLLLIVQASLAVADDREKILDFDTMVGVQGALLGPTNAIRGVNGAGAAWTLDSAKGVLRTDGDLEINVKGLVLTSTGANPPSITTFRAIVSCLTTAGATVNLTTDPFPATTGLASEGGGDAQIKATVALPQPCVAPIVFVTNPGGTSWFAVTGG